MKTIRTMAGCSALAAAACAAQPSVQGVTSQPPRPSTERSEPSGDSSSQRFRIHARPSYMLPKAVTSFGAVATSEHAYVLGGYFGKPHDYSLEGQSESFSRLDVSAGRWESLAGVGRIQSVTLSAFDGKIYRAGGLRIRNTRGEPQNLESVAEFARYDPTVGSWQELPPLPVPRSSHDAAILGSKLYLVGGWKLDGGPKSGVFHRTMDVLDLSKEPLAWTTLPVPFERRALAAAPNGNHLLVVGGMSPNMNMSGTTHAFDTRTQTWSKGPEFQGSAFGLALFNLDGKVCGSADSGDVACLTGDGRRWNKAGSLTFPRFFHQFVEVDNTTVLAIGGIGSSARVGQLEVVRPGSPADRVVSYEVEYPGKAKNRQGIFVRESQLFLFGGNSSLGQHDFAAENFLAEAFRFDLGTLGFEPLAPFPVQRQSMQTLVSGEHGYALGGFGIEGG